MATKEAKKVLVKANKDGVLYAVIKGIEIEKGFNVRKNTKSDIDLTNSVKENGVMNPLHVRWKDRKQDCLYLIDGERRLHAAIEAGMGSVPIVQHGFITDKEATIISLTANDNQKKLTRREQLEGFRRLKRQGLTEKQISTVMAIDKRTVTEALRVEEKASRKMKQATTKTVREGGVNPRVAARASTLPKKVQDKLVTKVKGKPLSTGLSEVRKAEKRVGVKRPGRKAEDTPVTRSTKVGVGYRIADDAAQRCKVMEESIRKKLRHAPSHKILNGQLMVIEVFKGNLNPQDVFGWNHVK